ncbi:MAG: RagB/SusD family nutrient uptake outer membrane protein [Bacteroidales bacterium]|nr:RagB/SusD family nutrient uptake outer membrane protein [Bacteroidales bacterium]
MKNIIRISLCAAIFAFAVACDKEYMETTPESSTSPATIFETTQNCELAINGMCKMMTTQYLSTQGLNGEGTIKTWYGNFGNDLQRCNQTGWASLWNHTMNESVNSTYLIYPWYYYYKLIGNANQVIENIDNAEGPEAERQYYKAQALVFRAHAFTMLMQLYAYRWQDSSNGSAPGIALRLDTSIGDIALSTQAECYAQIYADCDEAISLFKASGIDRGADEFYKPNLNVAYAVKARAALVREDWATVVACAPEARKGHPLMSKDQYMDGGFSDENNEWIWGVYEASDQTIYYYSFFAYQASNASSSMQRTYPLAISKELYDQIPETDVRRRMWLEPTEEEWAACNANGQAASAFANRAKAEFGDKLYSTSQIYGYMQFKFLCTFTPGGGSFNIYRSAEMMLSEAEAQCHLGNDAAAQALLKELNKNLDSAYDCTKTGADLLTEVKLYRRIDLWGEGFDWYDYKRWNEPIVRKTKAQGGSFAAAFAVTINVGDGNKWTWKIPKRELDYNGLIN